MSTLDSRLDRKAAEDYQLGEIRVPKDCLISLPIYALHTDPAWFPEPFQYRPERWVEVCPGLIVFLFEAEAKADIPQCAFLPFGVGPRSCIGMRLAMLTLKMTLVELLQDFTLKPGSSTKVTNT
ncbi:CYP3A4 [Cordylochernes scorpioides]|uniref:CYP3A4 n=1 Tax=Cordylochernes scorpioides TaxID=51811 RepID=A0ABY6K447_9ARAC|nr:CYP3A4 [Cordylochernes scorpioides]